MSFESPLARAIRAAAQYIGQGIQQSTAIREEERLRQEEIDRLERIRQEDIARAERIRQAEIARQERIRQENIARAEGIREEDIARREQELLDRDKNARIEQLSTSLIGLSDPQLRSQIENEINQIRSASTREELNVALGAVPGRQETTFGMQGGVGPESRVTGTRVVGGERDVSTLLGLAAQSVFDAERRREEQNVLDAAAIADAQARRNSLAASFTQLSNTLTNLEREGRGQSTIAVQISDSLAAIEQGMRMPITTGEQARVFNEYSEALFTSQPTRVLPSTVERAAPAMEARRDASGRLIPAAEEPVRAMGVQGALGAPQRPQARSVFPSIGVEEQPIGTPGELVARGTGVVARAEAEAERAAETEAEAERMREIRAQNTQSLAQDLRSPVAQYIANEDVSEETRALLESGQALVSQAFNNPYSVAPSELIAVEKAVFDAQTEVGDAEGRAATAENTLNLILGDVEWKTATTEQRLATIGQMQELEFWDALPETTKESLFAVAQFQNDRAIVEANSALVANAIARNQFSLIEGNEDAIALASESLAVPPDEVRATLVARAASDRNIDELSRQVAIIESNQALTTPALQARQDLVDSGNVIALQAIIDGDYANPAYRQIAENSTPEELQQALEDAQFVRDGMDTERLRRFAANMQTADTTINFLSNYNSEDIQSVYDTSPEIQELIGREGYARALRIAQRRERAEAVDDRRLAAEDTDVQGALSTLEMAMQNPELIGRRQEAFMDRPGGVLRGEDVEPVISWEQLDENLALLVEKEQMTEEQAQTVYRALAMQNQTFITETERALAEAEMTEALAAAGFFPNWEPSDWRAQILSLESAAESLINQAQVPTVAGYDADGNPIEVTCFVGSDPLGDGGWSSDPACQAIKLEYTETQATIRRFTRNMALAPGVQNLPPGTDISRAAAIGYEFVDEIIRRAAAGTSKDELNRLIRERYQEMVDLGESRRLPVPSPEATIFPPAGGAEGPSGRRTSDPLFAAASEELATPFAGDEARRQVMEEYGVDEREARRLIDEAARRETRAERERIAAGQYTFDELMARGRQAGEATRAVLGRTERQLRTSPFASRIPSTTPPVGEVQQSIELIPGAAPTPVEREMNATSAVFMQPESSAMAAGSLIAESGGDYGAIGRDATGGWSYGKYQFASNVGGLENFLSYLESSNPSLYRRLERSVDADNLSEVVTAGVEGNERFRQEWDRLSGNPDFQVAQDLAAERLYFEPAQQVLRDAGIAPSSLDPIVLQALGETSVNLGLPNFRVFLSELVEDPTDLLGMSPTAIVDLIYSKRLQVTEEGDLRWYRSLPRQSEEEVDQENVRTNLLRVKNTILGRL